MTPKTAQFLPFHAVNEFMRDDYRLEVVRSTLSALPGLPEHFRSDIEHLTRKLVQVPGFRNSAKAPSSKRIKPTAEIFQKDPHMAAALLSVWGEAHSSLRQQVYDLLIERGWDVLPPDADRTKIPGFITVWPKGEDFDVLHTAFREKYPDQHASDDDISLMVVWVGGRLPYEMGAEGDTEDGSGEQSGSETAIQ